MTKTRDLADLGGGFIQTGTGAVQRREEDKLKDTVSVKDFGAKGDGVTDDTAAFVSAVASLGTAVGLEPPAAGGRLYVPKGEYLITSTVLIITNVLICGDGPLSIIRVADGVTAFKFGRLAAEGGRVDTIGGVRDVRFAGAAGTAGNVAVTLGSSNAAFGFTTVATDLAGWKGADGNNATSVAIRVSGAYAPFDITGCSFHGLGKAIVVGCQYGITISNNRIQYCSNGIENEGNAPTTVNITNNTVERCAVGVVFKYPCSFLRIDHNVIEANYGGCDIYLFNGPKDVEITSNYFEASPSNIVVRADSSFPFIAERVLIERNTGVNFYIRTGGFHNYTFRRNWLEKIEVQLYANGTVDNIELDGNYDGPTMGAFNVDNIVLGTVAAPQGHKIRYRGNYTGSSARTDSVSLAPLSRHRSRTYFVSTVGVGPDKAFSITVPAVNCYAAFKVSGFRFGSAYPVKSATWLAAVYRSSGTDACTAAVAAPESADIPVNAGTSLALPVATVTIAGAATGVQTVDFNLLSGNSGGNTGNWIFAVEATVSNLEIDFA